MASSAYDYIGGNRLAFDAFAKLPERIGSPFFSADLAVTAEGRLFLLEIGDGGVSRLPSQLCRKEFYQKILALWDKSCAGLSEIRNGSSLDGGRMEIAWDWADGDRVRELC